MSEQQQSYRRAMNAAMLGGVVQVLVAIAVALMGLYVQSPAVHAIAWQLFGGVPIWAVLWLVYNQHRLEAAETLEVEQLRESDAAAAALFDEAGDRLALARKRLERLYRIGMPVTALLVGLYLASIGGVLFARHWPLAAGRSGRSRSAIRPPPPSPRCSCSASAWRFSCSSSPATSRA